MSSIPIKLNRWLNPGVRGPKGLTLCLTLDTEGPRGFTLVFTLDSEGPKGLTLGLTLETFIIFIQHFGSPGGLTLAFSMYVVYTLGAQGA